MGEVIDRVLGREETQRLRDRLEPQVREGAGRWFAVGCYLEAQRTS